MQARAILAILEDLVGQLGFIFDGAKTILEKEVGYAREEADGLNAVLFGLFDERRENASARALALGPRLDHDGAHFAQVRPVKVQRAAAEEDTAIGEGDGEVADVFANLREGALEQRAVARKRIDQVTDVGGVCESALRTSMNGLLSAGVRAKTRDAFRRGGQRLANALRALFLRSRCGNRAWL